MKRLRNKLLVLFLLISLLPMLAMTVYSFVVTNRIVTEKVSESTQASLKTLSDSIDNEMISLINEMDKITSSGEFQRIANNLRRAKTDGEMWQARRELDTLVLNFFSTSNAVTGIYFTSTEGKSYAIKDTHASKLSELQQEEWFQNADINTGQLVQADIITRDNTENKILVYGKILRDFYDKKDMEVIGSIHFFVEPQLFYSLTAASDYASTLLLNSDGILLAYLGDIDVANAERTYLENKEKLIDQYGSVDCMIENVPLVLLYNATRDVAYKVVQFVPRAIRIQEILHVTSILVVFSILCVFLSVIVSLVVSKSIAKPMTELNDAMKYAEKGRFDIQLKSDRKDEVGQVTRRFNKMVCRLESFFNQGIEDEKKKKELEIKALQYQISPHFLYNIMASVRSLALIEDADKTAEMLQSIASLLKNTVGYAGELVTVEDELTNIKHFLNIQSTCLGGRLFWRFEVAPETLAYKIPNLLLQPIVENAVFYGANEETGDINIVISSYINENSLLLKVDDFGSGFVSIEEQEKMLKEKSGKGFSSVGLYNTHERIRLNYGEDFGVVISNKCDGSGAQVEIKVPVITD